MATLVPALGDSRAVAERAEIEAIYERLYRDCAAASDSSSAGPANLREGNPAQPPPLREQPIAGRWAPDAIARAWFALHPLLHETHLHLYESWQRRRALVRHPTNIVPPPNRRSEKGPEPTDMRPSILIGMHWLEVGGAEALGFDCVRWALAAGLRVIVVSAVAGPQTLVHRLPVSPDVVFLRLDCHLSPDLWPEFLEALVPRQNIRLVHIHHCHPLYACLPALRARHAEVGVIDSTHIIEHADGGFPRISGVWSKHIDLHHVISNDLSGFYRKTFGATAALGRMIDRRTCPPRLPAPNLKTGAKRIRVAFVGRLAYQKRPFLVIECFRALIRQGAQCGLVIEPTLLGGGPFQPEVDALAKRRGIDKAVRFLPSDADVPTLLASSDFLILPSSNEGLSLVLYEAVQQGCLPLATRVGAQAELLPDALLVPPAPIAALRGICRAVQLLTRDRDALQSVQAHLQEKWDSLLADQTAEELLMPHYRRAAMGQPWES